MTRLVLTIVGCTLGCTIPATHAPDAGRNQIAGDAGPSRCAYPEEWRRDRCLAPDPAGSVCEFDPECPTGAVCVSGRCTREACHPETCDGYDNDCDGAADEGPLARYCWTQDLPADEAVLSAPCSRGVQVCAPGGTWGPCEGAVEPVVESGLLACDGEDNDCDGATDEEASGGIDVIFAIDTSGSMMGEIAAVREAARRFASAYAGGSIRYGIVAMPGPVDARPEVQLAPSTPEVFRFALDHMLDGVGALEPSIDVIGMPLPWRPGTTRILILFTDEQPQSYTVPVTTLEGACDALDHGEVVIVFGTHFYGPIWAPCAGSRFFPLTEDPAEMSAALTNIIQEPC